MKLCNHRYPRNAQGTCSLRCVDVAGHEWRYDSLNVFAKEGEMPSKWSIFGSYECGERMTEICPYRVHTPLEKPKPTVWVQCPYCEGRHRTELAVNTCKAYGEWRIAAKEIVSSVGGTPYEADGTRKEVYPDSVLKFSGFENVRAHIWPWMQNAIRVRDKDTCQDCGAKYGDKDVLVEVHHIIPRGLGGSDHPANLKLVCYECHKRYNRRFNPIIKRKRANERKAGKLKVSPLDRF